MKTLVLFSALIVADTTKWGFGEQFIKTLTQLPTKLRPEKVGNWERKTVRFESVEACGNLWAPSVTYKFEGQTFDSHLDFHWRRTSRLRTHGWIVHTGRRLDGSQILGSIRTYHTPARDIDWYDVFLSYCRSCKPHLATVHLHAPRRGAVQFSKRKPRLQVRSVSMAA